ncbi:MAG: tRNA-dihydrouridine(20/20a) synthase [Porticoccaceae bacterium]|nr:MAG: tRNA-dihydrouridine(20/20a) synthase [Porticoccaceae bacterium]
MPAMQPPTQIPAHRFCVAPMMDRTDRFFRYLVRLLSRRTFLYTEMVAARALLHGDAPRLLRFDPRERPLALQVGGSVPEELAACARLAWCAGYDEINLNCGCPSPRVASGGFGAALMLDPALVAECVSAMAEASPLPVTVKHRLGVDERDSYEALCAFVARVAEAGCRTFLVHARKAWLAGLSPRENREIPPLRPGWVERLKADFPHLEIVINGGIADLEQAAAHLRLLDGVMVGRAAYEDPWLLAEVDARLFAEPSPPPQRHAVLAEYWAFARREVAAGTPLPRLARHLTGLLRGQPGARRWRRLCAEASRVRDCDALFAELLAAAA